MNPKIEHNAGSTVEKDLLCRDAESFKKVLEKALNDPEFHSGGLVIVSTKRNALHHDIKTGNLDSLVIMVKYFVTERNSTAPEAGSKPGTANKVYTGSQDVGLQIDELLNTSREMTFENGLGTDFYTELESIIKHYRSDAILALYYRIIINKEFDPEVAAETLNWLGSIDCPDFETNHLRLWLLKEALKHPSPWVREGTTIGLSRLKDLDAIPFLRSALRDEQRPFLRKAMQKTIDRLERTQNAAASQILDQQTG